MADGFRRSDSKYGFLAAVVAFIGLCYGGKSFADGQPITIDRLSGTDSAGRLLSSAANPKVRLNGWLAVALTGDLPAFIDTSKAELFLDGRQITGLTDTLYRANEHALVFHLTRDSGNSRAWAPLLGSPTREPRSVLLSLRLGSSVEGKETPLVTGDNGHQLPFELEVLPSYPLIGASIAVLLVLFAIWFGAARSNILKDSLLPQLAPNRQPFSLGRCQMAFWFTVIFASYVFLFVLLQDPNTLTAQTLMLMGLSGATAVFAVAIDASKDTPIAAANETLRALGLFTYSDVTQLRTDIESRQNSLKALEVKIGPPQTQAAGIADPGRAPARELTADEKKAIQLKLEIADRVNKERLYLDRTRPFESAGLYRDITTDINGPALHRLQMVVWTLTLGVIFVVEVYENLSMPEFSATLLGLMGVTSAGYLGFKYPEKQN
jgi:hypothetical protein